MFTRILFTNMPHRGENDLDGVQLTNKTTVIGSLAQISNLEGSSPAAGYTPTAETASAAEAAATKEDKGHAGATTATSAS